MLSEITITRTRITTPRRRGDLISRPRLNSLLGELVEKRLVLVTAPAGYGKTSLLVDFSNHVPMPVCWYSIDESDKELSSIIQYIVAAIRQRFPAFGQKTLAAISGGQNELNPDTVATVLINDVFENITEHFLLILDDFHLVKDLKGVSDFFNRILLNLDENCHLIIASRTLLPLENLPLLAARSLVGGISYEELSFQPSEIQQWYSINQHINITGKEAETIQVSTEGWVTGIILASHLSPEGNAARQRLNRVANYGLDGYFQDLLEEYPDDLRLFLLWTSLLEEFSVSMCVQIIEPVVELGDKKWKNWMDSVYQSILFAMQVGEKPVTLRYHHLFLEYLQNRVFRERPSEARAIEFSLAKYYIQNNEWERAFAIYHRLDAYEELISLIESTGPELLLAGRVSSLSSWLDVLPRDALNSRPFIIALQGIVAMKSGDTTLSLALYNQAITTMRLSGNNSYLPRTLSLRANLERLLGRLDASIADCNECLRLITGNPEMGKIEADVLRCLSICRYQQGKLQNALDLLKKAWSISQSNNDSETSAVLNMEIGFINENLGNYRVAKENYFLAKNYWQKEKNLMWLSNLYNNLGVLQQLMGDYEAASESFEQGIEDVRASGYTRIEAYLFTGIADLYTELQADEQAEQAYEKAASIANQTQEHYLQVYITVKAAALAGLRGDYERGYKQIEKARQFITPDGSEIQNYLCQLEYSGLKILENHVEEVILPLEEACTYFGKEGHKILCDKAHLLLVLAYQITNQPEKLFNHMLYITSQLENEYPPVSLIALAARFKHILSKFQIDHLQSGVEIFLNRIDKFQESLPSVYQYLVKHARVVPFSPPSLIIRALGRMQVQINNHIISSSEWQTQAARDMFFMLLAHPEGMTKDEISLIFWPDASDDEVKYRFKNTAYRLRRAVGKNRIILEQNIYRFNNSLEYQYDVELFLKENALAAKTSDPMKKLVHFREAIKHYHGSYLSEVYDAWALNPRENLQVTYLGILLQVAEIYFNQSNHELSMEFCQRALIEDNLLEEAYQMLFRIHAATGNRVALVRQYKQCVEIFKKEINSSPSKKTLTLYENLLR
jgi:LuxR family transcriptional regulator, maltose regulon positive regulatory protein